MGNWQYSASFKIIIGKEKKHFRELKKRKDVAKATIVGNELNQYK